MQDLTTLDDDSPSSMERKSDFLLLFTRKEVWLKENTFVVTSVANANAEREGMGCTTGGTFDLNISLEVAAAVGVVVVIVVSCTTLEDTGNEEVVLFLPSASEVLLSNLRRERSTVIGSDEITCDCCREVPIEGLDESIVRSPPS